MRPLLKRDRVGGEGVAVDVNFRSHSPVLPGSGFVNPMPCIIYKKIVYYNRNTLGFCSLCPQPESLRVMRVGDDVS